MIMNNPQELLDFMSKNINYGYLGKNGKIYHYGDNDFHKDWEEQFILENSDDLLKSQYGNCFDQVEFERKWFLENNYEIKTIFEMVLLDYKNDYPTHSFLIFKDSNKWCLFENADYDNRGIHKFDNVKDLLKYQYSRYLELLKKYNIKDEEIDKIVLTEFDRPKDHSSSKEYLEHVLNSNRIDL